MRSLVGNGRYHPAVDTDKCVCFSPSVCVFFCLLLLFLWGADCRSESASMGYPRTPRAAELRVPACLRRLLSPSNSYQPA